MKLFELFATLGLDTSGFDKGVKDAETKAEGLASNVQKSFNTANVWLGNVLSDVTRDVTRAVVESATGSVDVAASVRATNEQFVQAFGDLQSQAHDILNTIAQDTNVLSTRLMGVGTTAFIQLTGAGVDANDALLVMEKALRLSADAAAACDITLEAAAQRLFSFMRGNVEAGDAINLFTSEAQRNEAALEKYGEKYLELNEAEKQMLMLDIGQSIYDQSKMTGQAVRESQSWANVTANTAESWKQIMAAFGMPMIDTFTPVLEKMSDFFQKNQDKVSKFSEDLANIIGESLQWLMDNGDAVGVALGIISTALIVGAVAAHPYAAAIAAVASGLAWLTAESKGAMTGANYDKFFDKYTDEDLQTLQSYVDAMNALKEAENAYEQSGFTDDALGNEWLRLQNEAAAAFDAANAIDGLIASYNAWRSGQAENQGEDLYLDVPLRVQEGSETTVQNEINNMSFDAIVRMVPDYSSISSAMSFVQRNVLSPKASGLPYVPYDNYGAYLHRGEAVLTRQQADEFRRSTQNSGADLSALRADILALGDRLEGMAVYMGRDKVGTLLSREMAKEARAGRRYGV